MATHRNWLRRAEVLVEQLVERGAFEDALSVAALGGHFALYSHPGMMVSPRLERALGQVSATLPQVRRSAPPVSPPRRVLHVATEVYPTGGHSRVLWRWISRDTERESVVVLTRQRGAVPPNVLDAAARVHALPPNSTMLRRAERLRNQAAKADVVVLHAHTFDPVPTVALAAMKDRPPIVFNDHSGAAFWFSRSVVDLLVAAPPTITPIVARHGIPPERYIGVPFPTSGGDSNGRDALLPLPAAERDAARRALLRELSWPSDTVLLLAVGATYKFQGPQGLSLLDLIGPVLARHPKARLLAAGVDAAGRWEEAARRTRGRVRALGSRGDLGSLYAAADIALDSFPYGGNGVAAEAASHGLPVLACAGSELEGSFCHALPCFGAHQEPDVDRYRKTLARWLSDPRERARVGTAARETVAGHDVAWEEGRERIYVRVAEAGPVGPLPDPPEEPQPVDLVVALMQRATGESLVPELVERLIRVLELAAENQGVRRLFDSLTGHSWGPEGARSAETVFAAPPADPAELRRVVSDFDVLRGSELGERFVMALGPDDVDAAVPVLEEALAEHPDLDLDLVVDSDPGRARPPSALVLD